MTKILELETDYEPIDLCECYEPLFYPPLELVEQWRKNVKHFSKMSSSLLWKTLPTIVPSWTALLTFTAAIPGSKWWSIFRKMASPWKHLSRM